MSRVVRFVDRTAENGRTCFSTCRLPGSDRQTPELNNPSPTRKCLEEGYGFLRISVRGPLKRNTSLENRVLGSLAIRWRVRV